MAKPTTKPMALAAAEHRVGEQAQRDDRLRGPALGQDEGHAEDDPGHGQADA